MEDDFGTADEPICGEADGDNYEVLIDQYVADGNRMIDEDATLNDIKQHTQFIVDEILAIKLPAESKRAPTTPDKGLPTESVNRVLIKDDVKSVH